jgi:hypothetical protein
MEMDVQRLCHVSAKRLYRKRSKFQEGHHEISQKNGPAPLYQNCLSYEKFVCGTELVIV